jgi:hypothetical protein
MVKKTGFLKGKWQTRMPKFLIAGGIGVVEIVAEEGEIDPRKLFVRVNPDQVSCPDLPSRVLSRRRCRQCKERLIPGNWDDFLPSLIIDNSDKSIVTSNISEEEDSVMFCRHCGLFHTPGKEYDIYKGDEKQIKRQVSDKALASIVYHKSIKIGACITGGLTSLIFMAHFIIDFFSNDSQNYFVLLGTIVLSLYSFLVGAPFGALVGAFVGRARNEANGRPPY